MLVVGCSAAHDKSTIMYCKLDSIMDEVTVACSEVLSPTFALKEQKKLYQSVKVVLYCALEGLPLGSLAD
jgi:hypothetical protein